MFNPKTPILLVGTEKLEHVDPTYGISNKVTTDEGHQFALKANLAKYVECTDMSQASIKCA